MANKIVLKKSSVAAKVPLSTDLEVGELAVNLVDQKLYSKKTDGTVILVGSAAGGVDSVNGQTGIVVLDAADVGAVGTITSSDGSINVAATGSTVDITVSEASPASTLLGAVRNQTGATLTKGTVVYISGATGNKALVSKAIATSDATSAQTYGVITTDLANNANGFVTIVGALTNLNTSAFTEGVQLYLSATTAGAYTSTKQYAPNHLVYVGVVTRSHPTQGSIEVKIQNGYEMDELHNVSAQTPSNGNVLIWNATTQLWESAGISAGTGISVTNGAGSITVNNTGVTSVGGTGTVNGITLTGTVTTTGNLTLGGTLSGVSLTTQVSGTLPIASGGTNATTVGTARTNLGVGTADAVTFSDITTARTGALTTGYIYFGNSGTKYFGYDGSNIVCSVSPSISILGSSASCTGNAATATTATNQSGGTVSATTGSFSGQLSVAQSTSLINNGINLNAAGSGYLRGTNNDGNSSTIANVQLMSWDGIGFSPSITGQTVPQGENAVWIGCRTGTLNARSTITGASFSGAGTGLTGTATSLSIGGNAATSSNTSSISNAVGGSYQWTGTQSFKSNQNTSGSNPPLQAYSDNGSGAIMSFHRGGAFAVNFGLDSDNVMRIGGWSAAANLWQLNTSGGNTVSGSFNAPIFYDSADFSWYVDPNGRSRLSQATFVNGLQFNGKFALNGSGSTLDNSTGMSMSESYGALWNGTDSATWHHQVINASMLCGFSASGTNWGSGKVVANSDMRATIFYDYNDTAWYCDPNSTSRFNRLTIPSTAGSGTFPVSVGAVDRGIIFDNSSGSGIPLYFLVNSSATVSGYVVCSGASTSYITSSDYRMKENDVNINKDTALAKIMSLRPITYDWKQEFGGQQGIGFIAHELQAVAPECVDGQKDAVNENGTIKPQGVDTSWLIPSICSAMQKQQQLIEQLMAKVAALEGI